MIKDKVTLENDLFIEFTVNEKEKTAEIIKCKSERPEIIIPRSIPYKSEEYVITSIAENSFESSYLVKSVKFSDDSELSVIKQNAFHLYFVESISIPSKVKEIHKNSIRGLSHLKKVTVSPQNPYYLSYEDKIILKKSSSEKVDFDVLFFSVCQIETVKIPSYVEIIEENAFSERISLETVEFPPDSKIRIIENNAFIYTNIESITFPPHLTKIGDNAFQNNQKLRRVEFAPGSELRTIGCGAFHLTAIESIKIPPHLTKICEETFSYCSNLKTVEFDENSELQIIEKCAFYNDRQIESIKMPVHLTKICDSAFMFCNGLTEIEIPQNSELCTIEIKAFAKTPLEKLFIPEKLIDLQKGWCKYLGKVTQITVDSKNPRYSLYDGKCIIGKSIIEGENFDSLVFCVRGIENVSIPNFIERIEPFAFNQCDKLHRLEMPNDSKLQVIEKNSFYESSIESISIPSSEVVLKNGWCHLTPKLTNVALCQNNHRYKLHEGNLILGKSSNENDFFNVLVFVNRDVKKVTLPDFIEYISPYAFDSCTNLRTVEISKNSKLTSIGKFAFFKSSIQFLSVPSSLTEINKSSLSCCQMLKNIEIPDDSKLKIIGKNAFGYSRIESFTISSQVTQIGEESFTNCRYLEKVIISSDSQLHEIGKYAFHYSSVRSLSFPHVITQFGYGAFNLSLLQIVEFAENTKLNEIDIQIFIGCPNLIILIPYN